MFDVVRSAGSGVYNYDNPVRRDVVNIGSGGDMTTIRFKTDNAGPWILHWFVTSLNFSRGIALFTLFYQPH